MYNATDVQIRYHDHQRQFAWVNDEGWKFDPPRPRTHLREMLAQTLLALATRLAPPTVQPRTT